MAANITAQASPATGTSSGDTRRLGGGTGTPPPSSLCSAQRHAARPGIRRDFSTAKRLLGAPPAPEHPRRASRAGWSLHDQPPRGWRHDQEEAPSPPVTSHLTPGRLGVKQPKGSPTLSFEKG